jgi:hypothetical protein
MREQKARRLVSEPRGASLQRRKTCSRFDRKFQRERNVYAALAHAPARPITGFPQVFVNPDLSTQSDIKAGESPSAHTHEDQPPMYRREVPHHFFLAACGRCGFAVDGEIRDGRGGWKRYDCNEFSRSCTHRMATGRPTLACPHLNAAKLAAQPLSNEDFLSRLGACLARDPSSREQELAASS